MAVYLYVFYPGRLPSKAALTRCFEELGFPLAFRRFAGSLDASRGGVPMRLGGEDTWFDLTTWSVEEPELADIKINPRLTHCAICQFGAGDEGTAAAVCFAVAVAKLANGALYDPQSGRRATLKKTIEWAHEVIEQARRRPISQGTRPRDIRRYLGSLLRQRNDLALAGDRLFVRPIRHLVRGASLFRSSYKYSLQVWGTFIPLYDRECRVARQIEGLEFDVWQPHFESLLMATLADEIFDEAGKLTTLADFAEEQSRQYGRRSFPEIASMVLAGELDRAAAYVGEVERKSDREVGAWVDEIEQKRWMEGEAKHPARVHWESLVKDVEATCAAYRAREIKTVKAMRLERFWEPAPFPIELPRARRAESAEPLFLTTPWPARPEWLWQQLPEQPGEVRYARHFLRRNGVIQLLVALTPEQAEQRHRAWEGYDLLARLSDGVLVHVSPSTSWDPNRPQDVAPEGPEAPGIHVVVEGRSHIGFGQIPASSHNGGRVAFASFGAHPKTGRTWEWTLDFDRNCKILSDYRAADKVVSAEAVLTAAERDLAIFPKPAFGEYMVPAERLRELLRVTGYGEIT